MSTQPLGAQRRAVESDADHLVVIAPPGCGKTEVLAMRADALLRRGVVRPRRRLLAITFTNRAKDNLRARLVKQLGEARLQRSVSVVNFHELGARLIESHGGTVGVPQEITFPTKTWLKQALNEVCDDWQDQKRTSDLLASHKRNAIDDAQLLEALRREGNSAALLIEQKRQEEQHLDYGDVLRWAQLILHHPHICELFQEHYDAILVDEFQDLTLQQFDIASRICAKNSTFVGDPYQGIFSWAGAQPGEVYEQLTARANEEVLLDVSFRSSPAVLSVVNAISSDLGAASLSAARPDDWKSGGHAYALPFDTDGTEARGLVALTDHLAARYPQDRVGVICRAEYRRKALERAYAEAQHQPQFWDVSLESHRVVTLLRKQIRQVDATAPFTEQVDDLMARVSTSLRRSDVDTLTDFQTACEYLRELSDSGDSLSALMAKVRDARDATHIQPGVHVLNAHVGKGQQFDGVIVMGLEEGHVPSFQCRGEADILEEQRVLLVMLSRARQGLFVSCAEATTNQYGRVFRNGPSRWWAPMAAASKPLTAQVARLVGCNR